MMRVRVGLATAATLATFTWWCAVNTPSEVEMQRIIDQHHAALPANASKYEPLIQLLMSSGARQPKDASVLTQGEAA